MLKFLKNKKTIFLLTILFGFFGIAGNSQAAVDLPWSTSYDCGEWTTYLDTLDCSGLDKGNGLPDSEGHYEEIITAASRVADGTKGQRHWQCDGTNVQTGGTHLYFSTPPDEFWFRFYMRYQDGYKQRSDSIGDKIIYVNDSPWIQFYGFDYMNISTGAANYFSTSDKGWDYIMQNGEDDGNGHKLSDGEWHIYEIHLKVDTNGSDGIAQMWVDEQLILNHTNCDFDTRGTWEGFNIGSNQKYPDNGECETVEFDDLVVNNTGYIGPIESSDTTPPSAPSGLGVN